MSPLIDALGWTLIHFTWQGAAIAALAGAALHAAASRPANTRYLIACAALSAMLLAPLATATLMMSSGSGANAAADFRSADAPSVAPAARSTDAPRDVFASSALTIGAAAARSITRVSIGRLVRGVVFAWSVGVLLLLLRMAGGFWRVRALHRAALAKPASRWQLAGSRLAERLHIRRLAHVVESAAVDVPMVIGWLRPAILLPVAALASLTPSQVEAILAHELAHIRRHDYLVNLCQTLAETLLFYHPGVWWISTRIRAEREHCCDEIAVAVCGDPVEYAAALTELESWRLAAGSIPGAPALAATGGSLLDRVRRILQAAPVERRRSPGWAPTLALTLVLTAGAGAAQRLASPKPFGEGGLPQLTSRLNQVLPPVAQMQAQASGGVRVSFDDIAVPPAPQAPPAPPAPPAPSGSSRSFHQNGTDWTMDWSMNGERMDVTAHGDITFNDELTDVASMSDGAFLKIREWTTLVPHTIEIAKIDGRMSYAYYVGGLQRPWDDEPKRRLPELIALLVRRSGIGAESRTKAIFARSGIDGVLKEIALLDSDYVRGLYYRALVQVGSLDATSVMPVLQDIQRRRMSSDFELRQTLTAIADHVKLDDAAGRAYVDALAPMRSDFEKRQALAALLAIRPLPPAVAEYALRATTSMASDFERRQVYTSALDAGAPVDRIAPLLPSLDSMSSDFEKRTVLVRLIESNALNSEARTGVLRAASRMSSDFERRNVLSAFVKAYGVDAASSAPFFAAVNGMSSDHERAEVLLPVAGSSAGNPAVRQGLVDAAERLSSSMEQNRVLAEIVHAERR